MTPQAKTLIEKCGFMDPDRKSTKHDEIQLWCYDHAVEILKSFSSDPESKIEITSRELERPISHKTNNYHAIVGYVDLFLISLVKSKTVCVAIEIKSAIHSCGDLVRQINFYRSYLSRETLWIVVCPDDRFKDVLKDQGIYFFKYRSPGELF